MSETQDKQPWPQFSALRIQKWLKLDLGQMVYYHFFRFGKARAILIWKTKHEGNFIVKIEERLWPDWPISDVQTHLHLRKLTSVDYEAIGTDEKIWYVVMEKAGGGRALEPEAGRAISGMMP